jgi:hypothetical protein
MYRRTLAAYWSAQPGELKADECIEDIFAGGDGWGDREKPYSPQLRAKPVQFAGGDSSGSVSESEPRHMRGSSNTKSHETLRPGDRDTKRSPNVRGRGSLEQQASQMKAEAARHRGHRPHHEVDEFDLREDLCSWRRPV